MSTTTAILCAFGVYLLLMIGIGVWCMKKTTGADDYFLGGRGLSGPVAALSAQASDMSGWLLMGLPGSIYALGTGQAWIAIGLGLGTIANWLIIAKPLRAYTIVANNSMTLPEFFGNRYHDEKKILLGISSGIIYRSSCYPDLHIYGGIPRCMYNRLRTGNNDAYCPFDCTDYRMGLCKWRFLLFISTKWCEL